MGGGPAGASLSSWPRASHCLNPALLLGDLKIAKFQKKNFVEAFNSSYYQPDLRYGHEVRTPSVLRWSGRCVKISSRSVNIFNKKVSV